MFGPGEILVKPNPAEAGKDLDVSYTGSGSLEYSVDGGPWTPVPLDPDTGEGKIPIPAGAKGVVISDRRLPAPASASIEVMNC